jgi:hypothetical protein
LEEVEQNRSKALEARATREEKALEQFRLARSIATLIAEEPQEKSTNASTSSGNGILSLQPKQHDSAVSLTVAPVIRGMIEMAYTALLVF